MKKYASQQSKNQAYAMWKQSKHGLTRSSNTSEKMSSQKRCHLRRPRGGQKIKTRSIRIHFFRSTFVQEEVHKGVCESHIGGRTLASKITRADKKCDLCQRFVEIHKAPLEPLHLIMFPWPFHKWGVNILGSFLVVTGHVKYLIVVVDYFTKWIEAEPVTIISIERVGQFYWKKLICCFGLPVMIVSIIGLNLPLVEHPQKNGQVESTNKVILRGLRRRLEEAKGRWVEELPQVLWSYHITPHSTTQETRFCLTVGTKEVREVAHIKEYMAKKYRCQQAHSKLGRLIQHHERSRERSIPTGALGWTKSSLYMEHGKLVFLL
ncbi:hypothetical protein CR513_43871, partial [Mucuna pruriens]